MANIKKKKKEEFNDLLLPIILVLCVMPFIIHLAEYSCGYGKYPWYADSDVIRDLYAYYRCYFFETVSLITLAVLAFRLGLYREKTKPVKLFLPLAIYGVMTILSTVCSVNLNASLTGNFYQFQGVLVLVGYVIFCFYTYQVMEREQDYKVIWYGICIVFGLLMICGVFQMFKHDLLDFSLVQRMIMSAEQYEQYAGDMKTVFTGNNVFLTLFNPNYAGVYLTMIACIFGVMCYSEKKKKKQILLAFFFIIALVLIWFTYSRSTLISLVIAGAVFFFVVGKRQKKRLPWLILGGVLLLGILLGIDGMNGFKYLHRMVDPKSPTRLESLTTDEDGIYLCYDGSEYRITINEDEILVYNQQNVLVDAEKELPASLLLETWSEEKWLDLLVDGITFVFGKDENGYYYRTENGKRDTLTKIAHVPVDEYEYLGSGRVYIWSRTVPLLTKYLLVGSGPDTFPEVFVQNDYVGKAFYAGTSRRIIEKPHNDFLLQWVQNGFLGFAGMLVFYIVLLVRGGRFFLQTTLSSMRTRFGCGCYLACVSYMVGSFFNDSTLFTTPFFWIFAGIALSVSEAKECIDNSSNT